MMAVGDTYHISWALILGGLVTLSRSTTMSRLTIPLTTRNTEASLDSSDTVTQPTTHESGQKFHLWDTTQLSAQEYENGFCFQGCRGNETVRKIPACLNPDCFPCDCDKPMCQIYGTCCPDISSLSEDEIWKFDDNISKSQLTGVNQRDSDRDIKAGTNTSINNKVSKLTCELQVSGLPGKLFIHSCPTVYVNVAVKEMCESQLPMDNMTVDTFTHIIDNETGVSYWNKYCAICNKVYKVAQWEVKIECDSYLHVYRATTYDELLRNALRDGSLCKISQKSPDHLHTRYCNSRWFGNVISECNVTGKWLEYDQSVDEQCRLNQDIYHRVHSKEDQLYSNIFCFICNTNTFPSYYDRSQCHPNLAPPFGDMILPLPFSLLINFNQRSSDANLIKNRVFKGQVCSEKEWRSPSGSCLPLKCSPGKVLEKNNCSTALQDIKGLGYFLRHSYLLKIESNERNNDIKSRKNPDEHSIYPYFDALKSKIKDTLRSHSLTSKLKLSAFYEDSEIERQTKCSRSNNERDCHRPHHESQKFSPDSTVTLVVQIHSYVAANKYLSRDYFESHIVSELMSNNLSIELGFQKSMSVMPFQILDARDLFNCSSSISKLPKLNCFVQNIFVKGYKFRRIRKHKDDFLPLTVVMTCVHVKFNGSEYVIKYDYTVFPPLRQIVLYFDSNDIPDITFDTEQELSQMTIEEDGTLKVCEDLLSSKMFQIVHALIYNKNNASTIKQYQYILTLICISLSMICLLLTLMTYFLFPKLRSAAGQNNIFLSLTLLLAQASLLATSHTEGPSPFCTALGITTHFLWLSMFCWSFMCCWNMFRIFTAKTRKSRQSVRSERLALIKKVIICTLVPALIIIIVVVTTTLSTNGNRIGYGDNICYMDSGLLVGVALVSPLGLILLCNISFFTVVIIKIHNVRKLQKHAECQRDDRDNLYVYVKLSTLTGAFWGLVIIAEITENDTIRIISIILNGLQGVFIFLSYVCNKRVFHMYLRGMGLEKYTTSTTTGRSTLSNLASEMNLKEPRSENVSEKNHLNQKTASIGLPEMTESKVVTCTRENSKVLDENDTGIVRDEQCGGVYIGD